jgi:hypothetical protein
MVRLLEAAPRAPIYNVAQREGFVVILILARDGRNLDRPHRIAESSFPTRNRRDPQWNARRRSTSGT